jgi:hypothetical protein
VSCNLDLISLHQSSWLLINLTRCLSSLSENRNTTSTLTIVPSHIHITYNQTQSKMFSLPANLLLLTLSALTLTSNAQTITYTNEGDASAAISRLSTFQTHLTAQPQFTSVAQVLETAIPDSEIDSLAAGTGAMGPYTTASWYSALPGDVKSYLSSVTSAELKLATATGNAGAPRVTGMVGMGVGVVGVLGAALAL